MFMTEYVAVRDNFGYNNTYWKKGDVVVADKAPNMHFELVPGEKVEEPANAPTTKKTRSKKTTA